MPNPAHSSQPLRDKGLSSYRTVPVAPSLTSAEIDDDTRRVFAQVAEEYDEICQRLYADDPVFGIDTGEASVAS